MFFISFRFGSVRFFVFVFQGENVPYLRLGHVPTESSGRVPRKHYVRLLLMLVSYIGLATDILTGTCSEFQYRYR